MGIMAGHGGNPVTCGISSCPVDGVFDYLFGGIQNFRYLFVGHPLPGKPDDGSQIHLTFLLGRGRFGYRG